MGQTDEFAASLLIVRQTARQKFRPTRRSGFSGVKTYMLYVEVSKNCCNTVGRTLCDAITNDSGKFPAPAPDVWESTTKVKMK